MNIIIGINSMGVDKVFLRLKSTNKYAHVIYPNREPRLAFVDGCKGAIVISRSEAEMFISNIESPLVFANIEMVNIKDVLGEDGSSN